MNGQMVTLLHRKVEDELNNNLIYVLTILDILANGIFHERGNDARAKILFLCDA
jgi:hypothetical protein